MLALFLALAVHQAPAKVTIVFGGDVIPHDPVKSVAAMHAKSGEDGNNAGWDHVLGPLRPAFQRADIAVVNLETPIVTIKKPETGTMVFNAQPPLLDALARAGVDVATFANNHCLDQHREGIVSTRAYLADAGLQSAGADIDEAHAWQPLIIEKNGLRIGLLALTRYLNGFNNKLDGALPHVPVVAYEKEPIIGGHSIDDFLATIRARAAEVDALIVTIHWGAEYKFEPAPEDRKLAAQMLEAGAFAVIGHHPHVLQPVEFLTRADGSTGLVVFSLGNLVSNQDWDDVNGTKRDGLLVELELRREHEGDAVTLGSMLAVPVQTENTQGRGKKRNVQALLLDEEIDAIEERLAELKERTDKVSRSERAVLEGRRKVALARKARISRFLPLPKTPGDSVVHD